MLTGPIAQQTYEQVARRWRFPHRFEAQGVYVAQSRAWGEVSGRLWVTVSDTAATVVLEGPLGIPLWQQTVPLIHGSPALPESLPWIVLWHWFLNPLRYPADTVIYDTLAPRWILRTPAGPLTGDALDTRPSRLYISLRREFRLMLEDIQPVRRFLWPFHVRYQGPEGTLEITWTRVNIPE